MLSGGVGANDSPIEADAEQRIAELRQKVDPIAASPGDIAVRHAEPLLTELVDLLLSRSEVNEARRYLVRLLQANPRAYRYQLIYGEILAREGAPAELEWRAKQAAENAEDDSIIRKARALADMPPLEVVPQLAADNRRGPELILVPVGDVSDVWLLELRDALRLKTNSTVSVRRSSMAMPPADRTAADAVVANLRRRLLKAMETDPELTRRLEFTAVTKAKLESDDKLVISVVRRMLEADQTALEDFNTRFEESKQGGQQWQASLLLRWFDAAITPAKRGQKRFLAVTSVDLYAPDTNYLFGSAQIGGKSAIISAARFTADFNGDTPHRPRLIERLLKQALSSYGQMLGVPRCTNPECARAYPHSLAEHDAKSPDLCAQCRTGFGIMLDVEL
ncbi:MAG TPA: archaemetzincin [Opitutaceae bacterium]|nr:archaemetzincin [Opitutaceae bacterium]